MFLYLYLPLLFLKNKQITKEKTSRTSRFFFCVMSIKLLSYFMFTENMALIKT